MGSLQGLLLTRQQSTEVTGFVRDGFRCPMERCMYRAECMEAPLQIQIPWILEDTMSPQPMQLRASSLHIKRARSSYVGDMHDQFKTIKARENHRFSQRNTQNHRNQAAISFFKRPTPPTPTRILVDFL